MGSTAEWVVYLDESQRKDYYFVGAALGRRSAWETVSERLAALRASAARVYGTALDVEFHGQPLMNGKGGWEPLQGRHRESGNTYLRALSTTDDLDIRFVFCGVDVKRLNARYRYPWHPHTVCMNHTLERINSFSDYNRLGKVDVVADESSEEHELQTRLIRNHADGTGGFRPSHLEWINAPMNFRSSAGTDGLQVVDLALYLKQRAFHYPTEKHPKANATRERLLAKIQPLTIADRVWRP